MGDGLSPTIFRRRRPSRAPQVLSLLAFTGTKVQILTQVARALSLSPSLSLSLSPSLLPLSLPPPLSLHQCSILFSTLCTPLRSAARCVQLVGTAFRTTLLQLTSTSAPTRCSRFLLYYYKSTCFTSTKVQIRHFGRRCCSSRVLRHRAGAHFTLLYYKSSNALRRRRWTLQKVVTNTKVRMLYAEGGGHCKRFFFLLLSSGRLSYADGC